MDKTELADLLRKNPQEFAKWLASKAGGMVEVAHLKIDFSCENFDGLNASGGYFGSMNFSGATFRKAMISQCRFSHSDLSETDFSDAWLMDCSFEGTCLENACLQKANMGGAHLMVANLRGADLRGANLRYAELSEADLTGANLDGCDLTCARINDTKLDESNLSNCNVYGTSVWNVSLINSTQNNLKITDYGESAVSIDNLKIAQFVYLLLDNPEIRDAIDALTSKVVLILGRFTPERKSILDRIREELRLRNYIPVLFDFAGPDSRDLTETIATLAHLSRFVVADLTDAKSIPQELASIVPHLPSVPVQPLLLVAQREYAMFEHFSRYSWVLPIVEYQSVEDILDQLSEKVIEPAEQLATELIRDSKRTG